MRAERIVFFSFFFFLVVVIVSYFPLLTINCLLREPVGNYPPPPIYQTLIWQEKKGNIMSNKINVGVKGDFYLLQSKQLLLLKVTLKQEW